MSDEPPKKIPINELRQEEGASELATSPDMEPYLAFIMASMQGTDVQPHLEALSKLPLEKRYVWRVASALKWGFADFDTEPVIADRDTLNPDDFAKVRDLLKFRPMQFCMFLKALVGAEDMKTPASADRARDPRRSADRKARDPRVFQFSVPSLIMSVPSLIMSGY